MKYPRIIIAIISIPSLIFVFAFGNTNRIAQPNDYELILSQSSLAEQEILTKEYTFWASKFDKHPNQYPYLLKMATYKNRLFDCSGTFHYLFSATAYLEEAKKLSFSSDVAVLQKLARNYIKMHRFCEAEDVLQIAADLGNKKRATKCIQFDVQMELGNYAAAELLLQDICKKVDFNAYIRKAKWEDHKGELDRAVFLMEQAMSIAKNSQNKTLLIWSYTNLADFYGHQNRIQKSYDHYLKALEIEPSNHYAKKGIAWINFAHDKNVEEALNIITAINEYYDSPQYDLLKGDIASYAQDDLAYAKNTKRFLNTVQKEQGLMHMYGPSVSEKLIEMDVIDLKALEIAKDEVSMRPIASSYALLAKVLHAMGEKEKAANIIIDKVYEKTFEPAPLLTAAEILKENQISNNIIAELKAELLTATYELGPQSEHIIGTL